MARRIKSPLRKSRKSPVELVCKIKKNKVRKSSMKRKSGVRRKSSRRRKSKSRRLSKKDGACGCDNGLADGCSE
jgi:uncharacterized protein (DUF2384 family)